MTAAYEQLTDLPGVIARARELSARTLIFDVEPMIAWWDSSQQSLDEGIGVILAELDQLPELRAVVFATNSARRPSVLPSVPGVQASYLSSAGKPFKTAPYRALPEPGVVIGDQVPTDGLLAHRLGYTFLHWNPPLAGVPLGPRLMQLLGRGVRPVIFRSGLSSGLAYLHGHRCCTGRLPVADNAVGG
jgi:predicted HAD superfamily phosphohydrolase YqeG